jgi:hypothetical protein
MDKAYIRSLYRRFWRAAHYAVRNRVPERYAIRDKLRYAFRTETELPHSAEIDNTIQFLRTAGRRWGVENDIVSRICHVHWSRSHKSRFVTLI